jgi:hypothetical protein
MHSKQWQQVPIYIAEIAPKNLRGGLATTNQVGDIDKSLIFIHC